MEVKAIKTRKFKRGESLIKFIIESCSKRIEEKTILAVTSKIVSLAESRTLPMSLDKEILVKKESDYFLGEIGYGCFLTIKEGLLIPSAGIDESNSEDGNYILYPEDPFKSAKELCDALKKELGLKDLGIILTDSHTLPLRRGVVGITLAYAGFSGVWSMVGEKDLYGRELQMTSVNKVDALSSTATLMMGEGGESKPLALITGAEVDFIDNIDPFELKIPMDEDLYGPLYRPLLEEEN